MNQNQRIEFLVEKMDLLPHPEGGFYKETYRSTQTLVTEAGERNLVTVIYFLLTSENVSRFHRIKSDEHWFFHEGSPLSIHLLTAYGHEVLKLGLPGRDLQCAPQQLVKADSIFGSTVDEENSYALVSCVVSPGFDFKDFELFSADQLLQKYPKSEEIIRRLT
ncbi:cupin domain-containing protein [Algoriphagus halophytocola]|uniref:cupin domain-containing protein n=1 Tax=Algoriphagus halophytocola TaxID=2991499 RepID=UPI0022DD7ABD|nr:cupin domain-containing protein [Algoriphagus sp. TR-M9]WBL42954.1 cupin domain-containing protein [Algoriphagus sp. TR-M9]